MAFELPPEIQAQLAAALNNPAGTAPSAAASTSPLVWLGDQNKSTTTIRRGGYKFSTPVPLGVSADEAMLQFQGWSDADLAEFQLTLAGFGLPSSTYQDLQQGWAIALDMAAQSWQAFEAGIIDKPLTPEEALEKLGQYNAEATGAASGTTTATETTNYSPSAMRQGAEAAFQSELGRAPGAGDVAALPDSTTSSTTTTTDGDGNSSSTTTGGRDLGQLAVEYARSEDDYAEYQAATTYMNAFLSAIGSVV